MNRFFLMYAAMAMLVAGCGESVPPFLEGLVPVSGTLKFKGNPAPGAVLTFVPEAGRSEKPEFYSSAVVSPDGTFAVRTTASRLLGDGIAPGNYIVTASWVKSMDEKSMSEDRMAEALPKKFQSPETTPIKVTITASTRELDAIELTE